MDFTCSGIMHGAGHNSACHSLSHGMTYTWAMSLWYHVQVGPAFAQCPAPWPRRDRWVGHNKQLIINFFLYELPGKNKKTKKILAITLKDMHLRWRPVLYWPLAVEPAAVTALRWQVFLAFLFAPISLVAIAMEFS